MRRSFTSMPLTKRQIEILRTYEDCGENASETARRLGISRTRASRAVMLGRLKLANIERWRALQGREEEGKRHETDH